MECPYNINENIAFYDRRESNATMITKVANVRDLCAFYQIDKVTLCTFLEVATGFATEIQGNTVRIFGFVPGEMLTDTLSVFLNKSA